MLKRHLRTDHQMSPEAYRAKWNLPKTYPMVTDEYGARRSTLAIAAGLGRKVAAPPPQKKRGRPRKS